MTDKPYIEYNDKTYEFEANRTLQRAYNKEIKKFYTNQIKNNILSTKDYKNYEELQKYVNEHPNMSIEEFEKNEDLRNKFIALSETIANTEAPEINEKYCRLMLKNKYNLSDEELNAIIDDLYDNYGIEIADTIMQKVCEKVFTTVEEKTTKKPLPTWMRQD